MALSQEHHEIRAQARRFADEAIWPVAAELDRTERFPADLYARMAELGLFGITIPEVDAGAGADTLAYALVMEELARGYASVADQCGLVELVGTLLSQHGSADQKAAYLAPLLRAERRCAYAITEAEAGSDVAAIRTTATRAADGWRLDGAKQWIHNAPVCDFAVVRLAPMIQGQPGPFQDDIRAAFERRVRPYVGPEGVRIPVSFKIASGTRPADPDGS